MPDKTVHIQDASGLEAANDTFSDLAQSSGASLNTTAVSVDGDTATVTFDVLVGGDVVQPDNSVSLEMVDGAWKVIRNDFCEFLEKVEIYCDDGMDDGMMPGDDMDDGMDDGMMPGDDMDDGMDDGMMPGDDMDDGMDDGMMPGDDMDDSMPPDMMPGDVYVPASAEEQAVMDALVLVFNPIADFNDKAVYIQDSSDLEEINDQFGALAQGFGASLNTTAVSVEGDTATVTFDVLAGSTVLMPGRSVSLEMVDGEWTISREVFCSFMALLDISCDSATEDMMPPEVDGG